MSIDNKCTIELMGRTIDPARIENLRLARVLKERVHDGERFLFNYGDGSRTHNDHTDQTDHTDHSDFSSKRHRDYTEHFDHYR